MATTACSNLKPSERNATTTGGRDTPRATLPGTRLGPTWDTPQVYTRSRMRRTPPKRRHPNALRLHGQGQVPMGVRPSPRATDDGPRQRGLPRARSVPRCCEGPSRPMGWTPAGHLLGSAGHGTYFASEACKAHQYTCDNWAGVTNAAEGHRLLDVVQAPTSCLCTASPRPHQAPTTRHPHRS